MARDFFRDLPSCEQLSDMVGPGNYFDLPTDWYVVLTDVKGSTNAIEAGRYKEVNMVGVSCIIAAQNALASLEFPFIFGGDGATLAIPGADREKVSRALSLTRKISHDEFGLNLRIAVIPVAQIVASGGELKVAKVRLSSTQLLPVLRGSGWMTAESWMKEREAEFNLPADYPAEGTMQGLECRWNPLPARKDEIVALIVQARVAGLPAFAIYRTILDEIFKPEHKPIQMSTLRFPWPSRYLFKESSLKFRPGLKRWLYFIKMSLKTLAITVLMTVRGRHKNLEQPYEYLHELTENTDYLKFDETLRMIIDVSKEERVRLVAILESHYNKDEIFYGYHCDSSALLTCFVQGPHNHIHFVDAAGGGYAMAAKQLKAQKKSRSFFQIAARQ